MNSVDCALFDVDGVLVDIRRSYNAAIRATVEGMIRLTGAGTVACVDRKKVVRLATLTRPHSSGISSLVTDRLILKFRQTGGFNNDTDTSYAITLALLTDPPESLNAGKKLLARLTENLDETGIQSAETYLSSRSPEAESIKEYLAYPPKKATGSPIARLFDELFYGPELFRKQNGVEPIFTTGGLLDELVSKPMIKNDRVIVKEKVLRELAEQLGGKLALITGRSRLAAEYSLGRLMKYFDTSACVFLEDEPREYAKPNPYAAKRAMKTMDAKRAVYFGDSEEDLLMSQRAAAQSGLSIFFVGTYGLSPTPLATAKKFRKSGTVVAKTVNSLPSILKTLEKRFS